MDNRDYRVADTEARRRHYGIFYGLAPRPAGRPVAIVHGNCQAESLRVVLGGPDLATVRIPPVHELTPADLPHLERLLAHVDLMVSQPVRPGYRGLPIGTAELRARLPPRARMVIVPVIRFAGLYPAQAIIRSPQDPSLAPPLVPYHDLRVLAQAAGLSAGRAARLTPPRLAGVAEHSRAQLSRREASHGTVVVSDLFAAPGFDQMRTINHPGNAVWLEVGRRVRARGGLDTTVTDPRRPVLNAIHAPREAAVIDALGLSDEPRPDWILEGRRVPAPDVRAAHRDWYATHPEVVRAGLERHHEVISLLGLR